MPLNPLQELIRKVSDHYDSDIAIYIGAIDRPYDDEFIQRVKNYKRRKNVLLILTTHGGDPHAAYRMARCLQDEYKTVATAEQSPIPNVEEQNGNFRLFVDTRCKSAGTILATGANTILFSDYGELGPIDVQLRKHDEVGERSSGLTPMHALESLKEFASEYFEDCFKALRFGEELSFSTKGASEIATNLVVGLMKEIYSQIDPMRLGEFDMAMKIAGDYGARLGKHNLKDDALDRLLTDYPSHGFVIDKKEALELFKSVEAPTQDLIALGEVTRNWWNAEFLAPKADRPLILYLTTPEILDYNVGANEPAPAQQANAQTTDNTGFARGQTAV